LAIAVRNAGEEINRLIADQVAECLKILSKGLYAFVPGLDIRRCLRGGPIPGWKFGRLMAWISRELKDVPMCDSQVLQHLPWRMRSVFGPLAAQARWELCDRSFEIGVRVAAPE